MIMVEARVYLQCVDQGRSECKQFRSHKSLVDCNRRGAKLQYEFSAILE